MKVAIVGSRGYQDETRVRHYVMTELTTGDVVISGGAKGVDSWAADAARRRGLEVVEHLPNYDVYGAAAPKKRNAIIAIHCDRMVAFWDGSSSGTANAVTWAVTYRRPVEVIR